MSETTVTVQDDQGPLPGDRSNRSVSRRSLIAGMAAAAGAIAAQAVQPLAASANDPNDVVKGATNNTNAATTVINTSTANDARGLVGRVTNTGTADASAGVWGWSQAGNGIGVYGTAHSGTGARGVLGSSTSGTAVRGVGGHTGAWGTGNNYGVRGTSTSNYGVYGDGGYTGVYGTGPYGVYGSGSSAGAVGTTDAGYGVYGLGPVGMVGLASGDGYGVWGYGSASGAYGVVGQGGYRGVYASGGNAGVYGTSGYVGVWGVATTTSGVNYGVYGSTQSSAGFAGLFNGAVYVGGFLTKAGGGFKIDHPLEPQRRYLVHSFVESPEMLNVYSGRVTLNARGRATVRLPRYFEAANGKFRYQLTAIGAAAPNLHVAREVEGNRFVIAGGEPGLAVSWLVTGVRDDAWARKNPLKVEPLKGRADRGKYLQPRAFGRPRSEGILSLTTPKARRIGRKPKALPKRLLRRGIRS